MWHKLWPGLVASIFAIGVAFAANNFLIQQPNGQWAVIKSTDDGTGVQQLNVLAGSEGQRATYNFTIGTDATFAANATDWLVVTGSASKTVRIGKMSVCGTATASSTIDVNLVKRSTADTGGTILQTAAAVSNDSTNAAATATVVAYSANPTQGTSLGLVDSKKLNLGTAAGGAGCLYWQFGDTNGQQITLRGIAQQFTIHLNAVTPPAGTILSGRVELTEE